MNPALRRACLLGLTAALGGLLGHGLASRAIRKTAENVGPSRKPAPVTQTSRVDPRAKDFACSAADLATWKRPLGFAEAAIRRDRVRVSHLSPAVTALAGAWMDDEMLAADAGKFLGRSGGERAVKALLGEGTEPDVERLTAEVEANPSATLPVDAIATALAASPGMLRLAERVLDAFEKVSMEPAATERFVDAVIRAGAARDPVAVLGWQAGFPRSAKGNLAPLRALAARDPQEAVRWAAFLGNPVESLFWAEQCGRDIEAVRAGYLETGSPDRSVRDLLESADGLLNAPAIALLPPGGRERQLALVTIAGLVRTRFDAAALRGMRAQFSEEEWREFELVIAAAEARPEIELPTERRTAESWQETLAPPPGETGTDSVRLGAEAGAVAFHDPLLAAQWVETIADSDLRLNEAVAVALSWAPVDAEATIDWLMRLSAGKGGGPLPDEALGRLTAALSEASAESLSRWFASLPEVGRNSYAEAGFKQLLTTDQFDKAEAFLRQCSAFDDGDRTRLMRRLEADREDTAKRRTRR